MTASETRRVVFPDRHRGEADHELATRIDHAHRIARLLGGTAEPYDPARHAGAYFVPGRTLMADDARAYGIRDATDLFGGVVPDPVVATKAITHPLVRPGAHAPRGWRDEFAARVERVVLAGASAFDLGDAAVAGERLLGRGPVRIKRAAAAGGNDQHVVCDRGALQGAIATLDADELAETGVVLEENLDDAETFSVGHVTIGDAIASYVGVQRATHNNHGNSVYGGSSLVIARGGFEALLALPLPPAMREAVMRALVYDEAAHACFAGLIASRRNYDVVRCRDGRCGVLEQSWRLGGASGVELVALEQFASDPAIQVVCGSGHEVYGHGAAAPAHATVHFAGNDPSVGPLLKYTVVEGHAYP